MKVYQPGQSGIIEIGHINASSFGLGDEKYSLREESGMHILISRDAVHHIVAVLVHDLTNQLGREPTLDEFIEAISLEGLGESTSCKWTGC